MPKTLEEIKKMYPDKYVVKRENKKGFLVGEDCGSLLALDENGKRVEFCFDDN